MQISEEIEAVDYTLITREDIYNSKKIGQNDS